VEEKTVWRCGCLD